MNAGSARRRIRSLEALLRLRKSVEAQSLRSLSQLRVELEIQTRGASGARVQKRLAIESLSIQDGVPGRLYLEVSRDAQSKAEARVDEVKSRWLGQQKNFGDKRARRQVCESFLEKLRESLHVDEIRESEKLMEESRSSRGRIEFWSDR